MKKIGKTKSGIKLVASGYEDWIRSIKERVQRARFKALMMANAETLVPQRGNPVMFPMGKDNVFECNSEEGE